MNNVLITGCSRGLGFAIANDLLHDCKVFQHYRNIDDVPSRIKHRALVGDITSTETLSSLELFLKSNNVNVFVNNAAIHSRKSFVEYTDSEIESMVNVNVTSQIKLLSRVYKHFLEINQGLIVNINSVAGIQPAPNETIYSATKHAMKGFSQSLQVESIGKNIRIVDIFPGAMKTDMTKSRDNYETLIDPKEVSSRVCSIINSQYTSSLDTEIVIRKFNRR